MKAQASIEFLVLLSLFILFLTPLVLLFYSLGSQEAEGTRLYQARQAASKLAETVDNVAAQGEGALDTADIVFPQGVRDVFVAGRPVSEGGSRQGAHGRELVFVLDMQSGITEVVSMTVPYVRSPLPTDPADMAARDPLSARLGSGIRAVRVEAVREDVLNPAPNEPETQTVVVISYE